MAREAPTRDIRAPHDFSARIAEGFGIGAQGLEVGNVGNALALIDRECVGVLMDASASEEGGFDLFGACAKS